MHALNWFTDYIRYYAIIALRRMFVARTPDMYTIWKVYTARILLTNNLSRKSVCKS
jgi:hypothetical protein